MRATVIILFLALFFVAVPAHAGWFSNGASRLPEEVVKALDTSNSITLYSIQPWGGPDLPEWDFHGHHQLGHVELQQDKAKQVITVFYETVSEGDANSEAMCLITPRHAIRVTSEGNTYDIVICFQCGQLELFKNDKPLPFSGSIGQNPTALNNMLKDAGIPLANDLTALNESYVEEEKIAMQRAKSGDAKAEETTGKFLIFGRGEKKNVDQGIKWLAKSYGTSIKNPDFEVKVAQMLRGSPSIVPDFEEAVKLLQDAADRGNAEAQYQLGYYYEIGEGTKKNQDEAFKWFQKAAEQGNPKGEYELGIHYGNSRDGKENYPEAMKWFRKAAEQGHPEAMSWIGNMYDEGLGVNKDLGEAYFWYLLSHEYYTIYGGKNVSVTSEQKAAAEKRVTDWKAAHPTCPENCH